LAQQFVGVLQYQHIVFQYQYTGIRPLAGQCYAIHVRCPAGYIAGYIFFIFFIKVAIQGCVWQAGGWYGFYPFIIGYAQLAKLLLHTAVPYGVLPQVYVKYLIEIGVDFWLHQWWLLGKYNLFVI
jgi:hypothetical protein